MITTKKLIKQILDLNLLYNNLLYISAVIFAIHYIKKYYSKINKILNNGGSHQIIDFGNNIIFQTFHSKEREILYFNASFMENELLVFKKIIKLKYLKNTNCCIVRNIVVLQNPLKIKKGNVFFIIDKSGKYHTYKNCKLKIGFEINFGMGFIGIDYHILTTYGIQFTTLG